jgi:phage recombination protein Bet
MPTDTPTREPELVAAEAALVRQAAAPAPPVTREQFDLVKRTVAAGASDTELKLFLYDCERRGVHPLDRLIHFTKRGGRYTPVVGIDYLRGRAADTGEMAGSDDAVFDQAAKAATVTVYRLTRGVRYAYTATARYAEYCPEAGPNGRGDVMWRKMPHTMLAKCAEALALRKAFPQVLAGLYIGEELEQARPDFTTTATQIADQYAVPEPPESEDARETPDGQRIPVSADRAARLPDGVALITNVVALPTKNVHVTKYTVTLVGNATWPADQTTVATINEHLASLAEAAWHAERPVTITTKKTKFGYDLVTLEPARELRPPEPMRRARSSGRHSRSGRRPGVSPASLAVGD